MLLPKKLDRFSVLVDIITKLRASDGGCPWDIEQTHASLRGSLLEECYEVLTALDEGDSGKLCTELGDLLMQIVMHSLIAAENGNFKLEDVVRSACTKLIRRHPHVFGEIKMQDAAEVLRNWEMIKKVEREDDTSMLASVPEYMPALAYSEEVQTRVARVGFDWADINGVIDKLVEEVTELKHAESLEQREMEFGDLLFTLTNIARWLGIDSEAALRRANKRFYQRFSTMEKICRKRGVNFSRLSCNEQNALWEEAKKTR